MGSIYEVEHIKLRRSFALKTIAAGMDDMTEIMARFQREAEVVASLRHPNIVEVSDWDSLEDGSPCMVLEFLRGEDLAARLRRGPLDWATLGAIADQVL